MESSEVKLHFLDYWRVVQSRAGLITVVFLLIMVTAGVTIAYLPREYIARVKMEVNPNDSKATNIFEGTRGRYYDPQFVATQFQVLKTAEILDPVIKDLKLIEYFSAGGPTLTHQQAFNILVRSLELTEVRNTAMIEVGVWSTDRNMAAQIANTVAVVYRQFRMDALRKSLDRGLSQFEDEVDKQARKVVEAAMERAKIQERDQIVDADPESAAAPLSGGADGSGASEAAVTEKRLQVAQLRTTLQRIEALKPEELREALHTIGIEDPVVTQNLPILHAARVEEANYLGSGLGENHPRIKALRAKQNELNNILAEALQSIRRAQATRLQLEEETLAMLETRLTEANRSAIRDKDKSGPYVEAKTKYLSAKKLLDAAQLRLQTATMEKAIDIDPVTIYESAVPPLRPARPPVPNYLALAAVIGLLAGVGLAFFIEYLDTSVKTVDDVERFLDTSVLAVVPRGVPVLMKLRGEHPDSEVYRILRANLEFKKPTPDAKTVTLISAGPGEGKSTTLNNLAYTCAKGGYNVLVVDADLRRPSQHQFFDVENTNGLGEFLTGKATLDAVTRTTKIDNLSFIAAGRVTEDAIGVLNSPQMDAFIEKVRGSYDLIFFDSPPILGVSDGSVLVSDVEMTIMVVQHRRFPRKLLQRVKQAVQQAGGILVGVVLNNVTKNLDEGYAYNAYKDYYQDNKKGEGKKREKKAAAAAATRERVRISTPAPAVDDSDY